MSEKEIFTEELCKCLTLSGNCVRIALILMNHEYSQKELCDNYKFKKAAVSTTIQKLKEYGIIESKQVHTSTVYYSNLNWKGINHIAN